MPIKASLLDDNTLEMPTGAPRLAWADTPLSVIDLGGGTFVVTEADPQVPSLSDQFRSGLKDTGVSEGDLLSGLEDTKRDLTEEETGDGRE